MPRKKEHEHVIENRSVAQRLFVLVGVGHQSVQHGRGAGGEANAIGAEEGGRAGGGGGGGDSGGGGVCVCVCVCSSVGVLGV